MRKLVFATRPSKLARWQTSHVINSLQKFMPELECEEVIIVTKGDKDLGKPLPEIGGKGLFTFELEEKLLAGEVDIAVHSLKDMPVDDSPGLTVGSIPSRVDPRDVLVSTRPMTLDDIPIGAVIGTSSLRRQSQILRKRPDIEIKSIRGNIGTRIKKVEDGYYDAVIMAGAGLTRLGLDQHISCWLQFSEMLPAPGQGALGIQCRLEDKETLSILNMINDLDTMKSVHAERFFLQALGGGCSTSVGAYAKVINQEISMRGLVASIDGSRIIEVSGQGSDPKILGEKLANQAIEQGANEVLYG